MLLLFKYMLDHGLSDRMALRKHLFHFSNLNYKWTKLELGDSMYLLKVTEFSEKRKKRI